MAVGTADMDAQDAWDVDDKVALDTVVGRVVPDHADQDTVVGRVVSDHADRVQVEVDPVAEMVGHSAVIKKVLPLNYRPFTTQDNLLLALHRMLRRINNKYTHLSILSCLPRGSGWLFQCL